MIGFVRDILRVLALPCRQHTVLFSRQLDEPFPNGIAAGLRIHTLYCGSCKKFRCQIRRLRDLAGSIGDEANSGESMPQAVRQRILRRTAHHSTKI